MGFYEFLRSAPYVRIVIPFICGIFLGELIPIPEPIFFIYYCIMSALLLTMTFSRIGKSYSYNWIWGLLLNITLAIAGLLIYANTLLHEELPQKKIVVIGTVIENASVKASVLHTMIRIDAIKTTEGWVSANQKVLCTIQKSKSKQNIKLNERIALRGKWKKIKNYGNPFEFDYKKYMNRKGYYYKAFIDSANWSILGENKRFNLIIFALKLRNSILHHFRKLELGDEGFAVVAALMVGDKSYMNDNLKNAYINSGTMHILAVSGMHIALLFWLLIQISRPILLIRQGKVIQAIIVLLVIWLYSLITGLTPSVVRAAVMFSFIMIGNNVNRRVNIYNILSASAILLLIINPQSLFDVGFQLSYLAVLGILIFYKDIYTRLFIRNVILRYCWSVVAVSLAAQLFTLPLTLYYFHQFPNYFLLSNIVALPLSTIIMYGSIFALITGPIKALWIPTGWLIKKMIIGMNGALIWIEELPYSVSHGFSISGLTALSILIVVISVRLWIWRKKASYLYVILLCCIVSAASILHKYLVTMNTSEIVVYNAQERFILHLRKGFTSYLLTQRKDYDAENWIKPYNTHYKVSSYKKIFIDTSKFINNHLMVYKNFLFIGKKSFYIWTSKPKFNKHVYVDVLIITKSGYKDFKVIDKFFDARLILVVFDIGIVQEDKLRSFFLKMNIPFKFLSKEGAWICEGVK